MGQCNETKEKGGGKVQKANVFSLCGCFSVYCFCVYVYVTTATGRLPNCS